MAEAAPETAPPSQEKHSRQTGVRLALDLGMRMALDLSTLEGADEGRRLAAELIGVVHFEFLILRLPWVPGLRARLLPGSMMTVRFVSSGDLCGFQSAVLSHTAKPALILFLEYPEVIEKLTLRQHRRVRCALPVQMHSRRGDAPGLIADLSRGGCKLALDLRGQSGLRQMVAGDQLVLRSSFSPDGVPQTVTCTVRTVDIEVSRMVLGVAFTDADQSFWDSLDFFLTNSELLD